MTTVAEDRPRENQVDSPSRSLPPHPPHPAPRQIIEFGLSLFVAAVIFRTFVAEGYFVPSGSMAPVLLGFHHPLTCPECGHRWAIGRDASEIPPARVTCPMCRSADLSVADIPWDAGDRVLVLKGAYDLRPPKRWEMVVFRNPNDLRSAYVKRAIGLPGESILIKEGDVFINGAIARKSFAELLRCALPVYDLSQAGRAPRAPARLHVTGDGSTWSINGTSLLVAAADKSPSAMLEYRHLDPWGREGPIGDENEYNAAQFGTAGQEVSDLIIRAQVEHQSGDGYFAIVYRLSPHDVLELRVYPSRGRCEWWENSVRVRQAITSPWKGQTREVILAYWDRRVGVRVDGKPPWADWDRENGIGEPRGISRPVSLAARDFRGGVQEFRIDRDTHYRPARRWGGRGGDETFHLGPDEYFMLGDNSAISNDSRSWNVPAIPRRLLVGKPIAVHLPTRSWTGTLLGRPVRFAYPDLTRIRSLP